MKTKNKKLKTKYADYCEHYLQILSEESSDLIDFLETEAKKLTARQEIIQDQLDKLYVDMEEIEKALENK